MLTDAKHLAPVPPGADGGAAGALPFRLPQREPVLRIRQRDAAELTMRDRPRTQALPGFEPHFTDIVDYIVRITDEIWMERAVGRIYDTYDHACTVYSSYGVVRSVEEVVAGTVTTINAYPDGEVHHLNVAWSAERDGFYTAHLGHSRSTNLGRTQYGPATGRRVSLRFAADCVSRDNRIHTEWLVRDNGALVRQLGLDIHAVAQAIASTPAAERYLVAPETRLEGQTPRRALDLTDDGVDSWARHLFHELWNLRRLDKLARWYAPDIVVHAGGGRVAQGLRSLSSLLILIQATMPDAVMRVDHVCHADETDGVIVAVRWVLEGTSRSGGLIDTMPEGKPIAMMGCSHLRLAGSRICEEWMVFDEVAVLAQAYRG